MERTKGAVVRPSQSIPRYQRPRLVVSPRTYMDVVAPTASPKTPVIKAVKVAPQPKPQSHVAVSFIDMKPSRVSPPVQHVAPKLKPSVEFKRELAAKPVQAPFQSEAVVVDKVPPMSESPEVAELEGIPTPPPRVEIVQQPVEHAPAKKKRSMRKLFRHPSKRRVMHATAAFLLLAGVGVAFGGWSSSRSIQPQVSALSVQPEKAPVVEKKAPSERRPSGLQAYDVDPALPRILHVPSLSLVARTLHLDADRDGSLGEPTNIYDAGWYTASARPADTTGAIVINGYAKGPTKQGIFGGLKGMKNGEEIILERGSRQMTTFVVKKVEIAQADEVDMPKLLESAEPGKLGLNLISVNSNREWRIIVYAVQK